MQAINEMIASLELSIPDGIPVAKNLLLFERPDVDNDGKPVVKRQHVRMTPGNGGRRIFAENWRKHGRFYCPPQNIPSAARGTMLINGEPVVEIDYSAHHPRLAYSLAGARLDGDPYDVGGGLERKYVKAGTVIAFNATDRKSTVLALAQDQGIDRAQANNAIEAIFERNEPIKHFLCNDAGIHLMHVDSQIMMGVSTDLTALGVPSIPVHDSVIVPTRFAGLAEDKMRENWDKFAGKLNPCSVKRKSASLPHMGEGTSAPSGPPPARAVA